MIRAILSMLWLFCLATSATGKDARPSLLCGGAEPFWSLAIDQETAHFSAPDRPEISYAIPDERTALGRDWPRGLTLTAPEDTAIALVRPEVCGDTMSDQEFGWRIDLLTQWAGEAVIVTGCCREAPTR